MLRSLAGLPMIAALWIGANGFDWGWDLVFLSAALCICADCVEICEARRSSGRPDQRAGGIESK
jgi:hypothetical protein